MAMETYVQIVVDGAQMAETVVPTIPPPNKAAALLAYEAALLERHRFATEAYEAKKAAEAAEDRAAQAERVLRGAERRFRCAVVGEPEP
jgi:hypothetical protein